MDAHQIAEGLLGQIDWFLPNAGYCRCPGQDRHTHRNSPRDCRVMVDGAPTIYCLHSSCSGAVEEANHRLRSAIGRAENGGRDVPWTPRKLTPAEVAQRQEAERLAQLEARSRKALAKVIADHRRDLAELFEESPVRLLDDPEDDWRLLLALFPPDAVVWIGDTKDSCDDAADDRRKEYCRAHFRTVREWLVEPRVPGQFTCPNVFQAGVHSRSNANVIARPYLVVESDDLKKDEILGVFGWMRQFMRLRAVVDTAGKSLHGWFEFPSDAALAELRVILPAMECDDALFKASQPCRLPGAARGDKLQCLMWLDLEGRE